MRKNQKLIQVLLEAVIPLAGFFFWDWNLYFILLFYFIDILANEAIVHLKSRKIVSFQGKKTTKKDWLKFGVISLFTLSLSLLISHFALRFILHGIDFKLEVVSFWNYTEMGLKQGYILVPIIVLMSYQKYKMEFLMPARYRNAVIKTTWMKHIKALIVILAFACLSLGVSQFLKLPEIVYVLGIVLFSSIYQLKRES